MTAGSVAATRVEPSERAFHDGDAKRAEIRLPPIDERARSMSAHPSFSNHRLVERVESLHQKALERSSSRHPSDHLTANSGITLTLHGDLNPASAPYLQGVLHAVVLLQPDQLSVNLSQVGHVSRESLRLIEWSGEVIGSWSLLDPSPSARTDLINLGRSELIESETVLSATA